MVSIFSFTVLADEIFILAFKLTPSLEDAYNGARQAAKARTGTGDVKGGTAGAGAGAAGGGG